MLCIMLSFTLHDSSRSVVYPAVAEFLACNMATLRAKSKSQLNECDHTLPVGSYLSVISKTLPVRAQRKQKLFTIFIEL